MEKINLKENSAIILEDGFKYWVIKKVTLDNVDFYYTIRLENPATPIVFADTDTLQIVEDEELLMLINQQILKSVEI